MQHAFNNVIMIVELFGTDIPYQQSKIGYAEFWTVFYWTVGNCIILIVLLNTVNNCLFQLILT